MMDAERRQRIEDLCHAALDRSAQERSAFVAAECRDDETMRWEVENLLSHAARAERFLATPVSVVAAHILTDEERPSLVGRNIGSHKILSLLGAGGMGEVYRAHDSKLCRDVAIKVIPERFLSMHERLTRFDLEARVLATLNHPHIAAIYGLEESDGIRGLVLELVEGETLAERLAAGPLSVREGLDVARQIADALEAAHEKGIIHRDLKPANIKITADGTVKVLDFGLAKVFAPDELRESGSHTPPIAIEPSREGVIAGTTAYMSPEQTRGKTVDKRTDIWAFGCVMYEMLTARPAFQRETSPDTVAAILEHEPDWTALPAPTPANVRRLLQRCLEKDAKRRLRDVGDARLEIEEALHPISGPETTAVGSARRIWSIAAGVVISLAVIAGVITWDVQRSDVSAGNPLEGATVARLTAFEGAEEHAAISRDGKFVAFVSDRDGPWDAWVSQVGTDKIYNLTKGALRELRNPATRTLGFSPDGSLIALWSRKAGSGSVDAGWTVPTLGGQLQAYMTGIAELDWSPDGKRLVYHPPAEGDPLFVTAPNEKVGHQIYVGRPGFHNHFPIWSADGTFIYFVHGLPLEESDIWRIRADGGEPERLTFHDSRVAFPTLLNASTLMYLATDRDGSGPWIHALDLNRRTTHRISTGLEQYTSLSASADGRRIVATVSRSTEQLWRVPIEDLVVDDSRATPVPVATAGGLSPRIGPGYVIYRAPKTGRDALWRVAADGAATELWNGSNGRVVGGPAIAPGGQRLAFSVQAGERTQLYVMNSDGTGTRRVAEELDVRGAPAWSPDARWLAVAANQNGEPHLFKILVTNGGSPVPLVSGYSTDPSWSPSGQFLVYSGADVGTTFPVKAVGADGTSHPVPNLVLTRGARRLLFLNEDTLVFMKGDISHQEFWSVDLKTGRERQLTTLRPGFIIRDFDISPDGREIIFDRTRDESDVAVFDLPNP
jgi:serine/threonine protein kinase/Tol biopolymer transport system component